jgi:hypothetical protein
MSMPVPVSEADSDSVEGTVTGTRPSRSDKFQVNVLSLLLPGNGSTDSDHSAMLAAAAAAAGS